MDILNNVAFTNTLERCHDNPQYSVGVMFSETERQKEFMTEMRDSGAGAQWSVNVRKGTIKFKNGSYIIAVPTAGGTKVPIGYRFNEILFDGSFSDDVINSVYAPMLKPYIVGENITDSGSEDTSLDDFLGAFKVN